MSWLPGLFKWEVEWKEAYNAVMLINSLLIAFTVLLPNSITRQDLEFADQTAMTVCAQAPPANLGYNPSLCSIPSVEMFGQATVTTALFGASLLGALLGNVFAVVLAAPLRTLSDFRPVGNAWFGLLGVTCVALTIAGLFRFLYLLHACADIRAPLYPFSLFEELVRVPVGEGLNVYPSSFVRGANSTFVDALAANGFQPVAQLFPGAKGGWLIQGMVSSLIGSTGLGWGVGLGLIAIVFSLLSLHASKLKSLNKELIATTQT